jgi:Fur family ferric uptake transcriptional regulator
MHVDADQLVTALRAAGLRVTRSRRAVCEMVAAHHDEHLTAQAIADRLDGDVDQSTVYRTLDALEKAGVVTHTHLGHGPLVYHLAEDEPHQHLVCSECGSAVAFDPAVMDAAVAEIRRATGFEIDPSHYALGGRCAACAGRGTA